MKAENEVIRRYDYWKIRGYELRFKLWETEVIFKNKNFGRLSQRRYSPKYTNIGVQTQGRGIV